MIIKKVSLNNFRCHEKYELSCKKKTSLIIGENGSGKTSVLEAIYLALRGKSFRAVDGEILRRDADFYRVELVYENGEKVVVAYDGLKRQFMVADKKSARLPKKYRYPVVLFVPDDLHLVKAGPATRREYFDRILSQLDDLYSNALSRYNKALKQRNELLKNEPSSSDDLFSWNLLLAKYGCEIHKKRIKLVEEINLKLTEVYRTIAENGDEVKIDLLNSFNEINKSFNESEYLNLLEKSFQKDVILGHTSFGVHRDNYEFIFNNKKAEGSASRGEVRSVILALKFIEAEMILKKTSKKPVVLLDDVFSELDEKRQKCLVQNFKDNQVIITSVNGVES